MEIKKDIQKRHLWLILFCITALLSGLRYFYTIDGDYFTFLDEYITFDTAVGYRNTGTFYQWDFHKGEITESEYTRAFPHTVLLGAWFRIFGTSVVSGKTLSCLFGILFIFSVFYITKKVYNNCLFTFLSCMLLLSSGFVTTIFRQIRMYSLWLLSVTWMIYFIYMALTEENHFKRRNRFTSFIENNFNFHLGYMVGAMFTLVLSFVVHINTLVIGVGVILYLLQRLIVTREKKYKVLSLIFLFFLICIAALCMLPVDAGIFSQPVGDAVANIKEGVEVREVGNYKYILWMLELFGSKVMVLFLSVFFFVSFCQVVRTGKYCFILYHVLIAGSTVICFVFFLSRYMQGRYMIYMSLLLAIMLAYGIAFFPLKGKNGKYLRMVLVTALMADLVWTVAGQWEEVYNSKDICRHREAYEVIKADATYYDMPLVPVVGYDFRDYYGVQVFDEYETATIDREQDMNILLKFAEKYPSGYLAVESAKINGITEPMKMFMQKYAEKIAGVGLDDYNIEVCKYHFLYAQKVQGERRDKTGEGGILQMDCRALGGSQVEATLVLDSSQIEKDTKIIFLKFLADDIGEQYFQLVIPESTEGEVYRYRTVLKTEGQDVRLAEQYGVYNLDNSWREAGIG